MPWDRRQAARPLSHTKQVGEGGFKREPRRVYVQGLTAQESGRAAAAMKQVR